MKYKKCNVVMLPTEKASNIALFNNKEVVNQLCYSDKPITGKNMICQYLYFLSEEEVKEGDWCYTIEEEVDDEINIIDKPVICKFIKTIHKKYIEDHYTFGFYTGNTVTKETYYQFQKLDGTKFSVLDLSYLKKIIATTDEELGKGDEFGGFYQLPQIPIDFIKLYCEQGGIDKVLVEYERDEKALPVFDGKYEFIKPERLKVAPDNTITIKPVKESWSREEVVQILRRFDMSKYGRDIPTKDFDNWIEENL